MAAKPIVPIAFKEEPGQLQKTISILAADIGGTKTNMALYRADGNGLVLLQEKRYVSRDHASLTELIHDFAGGRLPDRICAAVAGPLVDGRSKLPNLSWQLDSEVMSQ